MNSRWIRRWKQLSLLFCVSFLASLLLSCQGGGSGASDTTESAQSKDSSEPKTEVSTPEESLEPETSEVESSHEDTTEQEETTESSTEPSESDQAPKAYEGEPYPIRILGGDGITGKFRFSERDRYKIWDEFEELLMQYGLKPEFETIANDQYETAIHTRMSAGVDVPEFANLTALGDTTIFKLAERGMILPLNEIVDKYTFTGESKAFFEEGFGSRSWRLNTRDDGQVYFISNVQESYYKDQLASTCIVMQIRQDWLEALDLKTPTTLEEFRETLKAFQEKDANGNGSPDEIISHDFAHFGGGISEWFGLVQGLTNFSISNGKPSNMTSPWYQEGIKDYFTYVKSLYDEGLIDPSVIGATVANQNIENNRAAVVSNYCMATWLEPMVVGAEEPKYQPFGPIQALEGVDPLIATEPPALSFGRWGFTSEAKNMEANGRLLDLLASERYAELTQWGIKGETYQVNDKGQNELLPIAKHDAYDEAYEKGIVLGDFLWGNGGMFPKIRKTSLEPAILTGVPYKADYQASVIDYAHTTPLGFENYLPVEEEEQSLKLQSLSTDLNSRSLELASNLIMGNESLDDWDQHIQGLEELGLREVLEIHQKRLDKAIEMGIFD